MATVVRMSPSGHGHGAATGMPGAGARVLVVGLGVTGAAVLRHGHRVGWAMTSADDANEVALAGRREDAMREGVAVVLAPTAGEWSELVAAHDLVVVSPGVPLHHPLRLAAATLNKPVWSEIELAARISPAPYVAVTGTNGKTTVTTLIAIMLQRGGREAIATGNIGHAFIDAVAALNSETIERDDSTAASRRAEPCFVVEVSSFQLHDTAAFAPRAAVLCNIADDHLDWHGGLDAYARDKARIFAGQQPSDLAVFNADDPIVTRVLAEMQPVARRVGFSLDRDPRSREADGWHLDGQRIVDPSGGVLTTLDRLPRALPHDIANAMAAAAVAADLGVAPDAIASALHEWTGLAHRVTLVAERDGIRYFDDSKATNPHATLGALAGFDSVVLIAGGRNKGLDLSVLQPAANRLRAVVAIGEAGPEIVAAMQSRCRVVEATSMADAVRVARAEAQAGDAVLLSPMCASFDWYRNYAERGDDFAAEVREQLGLRGTERSRDEGLTPTAGGERGHH